MRFDVLLIAIVLVVVLFLALVVSANYGRRTRSGSFPFLIWIGLTVATLVAGAIAAFVIGAGLVVFLGPNGGGIIGLGLAAAILVGAPVGWAFVLRRRAHQAAAQR